MKNNPVPAVLCCCAALATTMSTAQDMSSLVGTYQVAFVPVQSGGVRHSCALTFSAVTLDYIYRRGLPVMVAGSITYWTSPEHGTAVLALKLATALLNASDAAPDLTPPFFAYIQTPHANLSRSEHMEPEADQGFKLFIYQLDSNSAQVMKDLMSEQSITVGFNMKKDGLDVLVPLDLSVARSYEQGGQIRRLHSSAAVDQFTVCVGDTTQALLPPQ